MDPRAWLEIYLGDMQKISTVVALREYGKRWASDLSASPFSDDLREAYRQRMSELSGGDATTPEPQESNSRPVQRCFTRGRDGN